MPVDKEELKSLLRAEFAEFELRIERMLGERLNEKIGMREHRELEKRVDEHGSAIESLESWRSRIIGAVAVIGLLAGAALEIAVKHYL